MIKIYNNQSPRWDKLITKCLLLVSTLLVFVNGPVNCQKMPDVRGQFEEYPVGMVNYWQSREILKSVQVAILRDPSGEQEARFDLTHGATLISLRYKGHELLFGHSAGANVEMFRFRHGKEQDLQGLSPYWSAFHPSQGGTSMDVASSTTGIACDGDKSMRAFAVMIDAGVNNSFERDPFVAVWKGKLSENFPPGYSTSYTIETDANWVKNPDGEPKYYLKLHQSVVNIRPSEPDSLLWFLEGAAPWNFNYMSVYQPEGCSEKNPTTSAKSPVLMGGRYTDSDRTDGFSIVVPTKGWNTDNAYVLENAEYVKLLYGAVWAAPRHTFAVVLSHPFPGLTSYSFDWYICAGSWEQSKKFGTTKAIEGNK
jgi:hypothetical protein